MNIIESILIGIICLFLYSSGAFLVFIICRKRSRIDLFIIDSLRKLPESHPAFYGIPFFSFIYSFLYITYSFLRLYLFIMVNNHFYYSLYFKINKIKKRYSIGIGVSMYLVTAFSLSIIFSLSPAIDAIGPLVSSAYESSFAELKYGGLIFEIQTGSKTLNFVFKYVFPPLYRTLVIIALIVSIYRIIKFESKRNI